MIKWFIIIPLVLAGLITGLSIYLQPNDFIGCSAAPLEGTGSCEKADAIVVVSGGDTVARTEEGVQLFKHGWADNLVLSGAAQDKTGLSNAAAMKLQAQADGVPSDAILLDEASENTAQNAQDTESIFETRGFHNVILVTSGYHQRRADLEFEKSAGTSVKILNHPLLTDRDWSFWWWTTPSGWWLAGSEVVKIIAFYVTGAM